MRKVPPIPVPPGQHYCFTCEKLHDVSAFYKAKGKPNSPCKACRKDRPRRDQWLMDLVEEGKRDFEAHRATNPRSDNPAREYAPMNQFAQWLAKREAAGLPPPSCGAVPAYPSPI